MIKFCGGIKITLLTFNVMKDKLLHFEKQQTIRENVEFWMNQKIYSKLDIWWLNPRNQHPDCRKLGIANPSIYRIKGIDITEEIAIADGFLGLEELRLWFVPDSSLQKLHVFYNHEFAMIRWEWIDTYWICGCGDYIDEGRVWGHGAMCAICESVDG